MNGCKNALSPMTAVTSGLKSSFITLDPKSVPLLLTCAPIIFPRINGCAVALNVLIPCLPLITILIGGSWNVCTPLPVDVISTWSERSSSVDNLKEFASIFIT